MWWRGSMKKISLETAKFLGVPFFFQPTGARAIFKYVRTDEGLALLMSHNGGPWRDASYAEDIIEFVEEQYGIYVWEEDQS